MPTPIFSYLYRVFLILRSFGFFQLVRFGLLLISASRVLCSDFWVKARGLAFNSG
jgi:hypothetical protein